MIKYSLKCVQDHGFDSWFKSAEAFDTLRAAGLITCPSCGNSEINKAIMAPQVKTSRNQDVPALEPPTEEKPRDLHALTVPSSPAEAALIELKKKIQENSEYVGSDFASEARKIHDGDAPERSIYGEAEPEEAKKLVDDGVPVAPLPFLPDRKTN